MPKYVMFNVVGSVKLFLDLYIPEDDEAVVGYPEVQRSFAEALHVPSGVQHASVEVFCLFAED